MTDLIRISFAWALLTCGCNAGEQVATGFSCEKGQANDRVARWTQDLDCFQKAIKTQHPDPFAKTSEADFDARMQALRADVGVLEDGAIAVELARIAATLEDAHTTVYFSGGRYLPVHVYWFAGELYVVRAREEESHLVGQRVISLGGQTVSDLWEVVAPMISHEAEQWALFKSSKLLVSSLVLAEVGIDPPVELEVADASGVVTSHSLSTLSASAWSHIPDSAPEPPLYRRNTDAEYWYAEVPEHDLVYVAYNSCTNNDNESFGQLTMRVMDILDADRSQRLVLDLRNNTGGSSLVFAPMLNAIRARSWLDEPDRVFVVVGRQTFSSGVANAYQLAEQTNATFVGEEMGQPRASFGEVRSVNLPFSGLHVSYSTRYFVHADQDLEPDLFAPPSAATFFAGRDPALDAVTGL